MDAFWFWLFVVLPLAVAGLALHVWPLGVSQTGGMAVGAERRGRRLRSVDAGAVPVRPADDCMAVVCGAPGRVTTPRPRG